MLVWAAMRIYCGLGQGWGLSGEESGDIPILAIQLVANTNYKCVCEKRLDLWLITFCFGMLGKHDILIIDNSCVNNLFLSMY